MAVLFVALSLALVACGRLQPAGADVASAAPSAEPAASLGVVATPASAEPTFVFPSLAPPRTIGDVNQFAEKLLYERTGRLCYMRAIIDPGGPPDWEGMARTLSTPEGLLSDGISYVGDLSGTFYAFGVEPSGIELPDLAYGIGRVPSWHASPSLPEGAWWLPEFGQFSLKDGRSGWYWTGQYIASPPTCSV